MRKMSQSVSEFLNTPFVLSEEQIAYFRDNGFIKLKQVLSKQVIAYMDLVVTEEVNRLNNQQLAIEDRDTYGKAFLQIMNIWKNSEHVKEVVFSKRLAQIATNLLEVTGVRIYHDQALYKEPSGGHTPWHAVQYYWPLDSDKTITAWIPLQATPLEMGPLEFSAGSHEILEGRELSISDDSEIQIHKRLKVTDYKHVIEPFDAGEISFHSGWVFHRAGANTTDQMRKVMTIIYMDKNMT